MKPSDIIRKIINLKKMKYAQLAYQLNISRGTLSERLNQENISINKMNEMLQSLGYKIIVVPYNTNIKDDWFEIKN